MSRNSTHRLFLSFCGLCLALGLFFSSSQPTQALSFIDRLFGKMEDRVDHIDANEKASTGTSFSVDSTADNMLGAGMAGLLIRVSGGGAGLTKAQAAFVKEKYGDGAIAEISQAIPYLFQPPASSQIYIADLLDSAHIIPKAQAQGLGFAALNPVLETWKAFRNLAYLVYVIIFLVIGLMVMFKSKMGKTAVTLQSAIPNIIISMVFVTFSYAIAGFLIDMMYILMYLLVGMFPNAGAVKLMDKNFIQIGTELIVGSNNQSGAFKTFADSVDGFVSQALDSSGTDQNNTWYGWISGMTMALIMSIAILVGVFKLFFELLKTYVIIILMIAFSPMLLMLGALPGQDVFQGWIRDLAGHLLVFPTTLLIVIVFNMFTNTPEAMSAEPIQAGGFMPPFLIGRGSAGALTTLVGVGILLIMPELIAQMKKAVGVKEGIFTQFIKDASKNIKDGTYYGAMPLAAPASAISGAVKAGKNYVLDTNPITGTGRGDFRGLMANMWQGNKEVDSKGQVSYRDGVLRGWKNIPNVAKALSGTINNLADGKFKAEKVADQKDKHDAHKIAREKGSKTVSTGKGAY